MSPVDCAVMQVRVSTRTCRWYLELGGSPSDNPKRFPPPPPFPDLQHETDSDTSRPGPDKVGHQQGFRPCPADPVVQDRTHPTHDRPKERHEKCLACVQRPQDLAELEDLWSGLSDGIRASLLDLARATASAVAAPATGEVRSEPGSAKRGGALSAKDES